MAGVCLGLAGAAVALHTIPKSYEAIATIRTAVAELASSATGDGTLDPIPGGLAAVRDELLREEAIVETIWRVYGVSESPERMADLILEVRDNIAVALDESRMPESYSIEIRYRDTDARRSASIVDALAGLYLARRSAGETGVAAGPTTTMLDAAEVPAAPYSPKPLGVYAVFLVLGLVAFPGPVVARAILRPVISSEKEFGALCGLPVLATIPDAATDRLKRTARRRTLLNVSLSILSGVVLWGTLLLLGSA